MNSALHLLALNDSANSHWLRTDFKKRQSWPHGSFKRHIAALGLGRALLNKSIEICRRLNMPKITLSSQTHAIKFYENAGFVVTSEAYIDANIWHKDMELIL